MIIKNYYDNIITIDLANLESSNSIGANSLVINNYNDKYSSCSVLGSIKTGDLVRSDGIIKFFVWSSDVEPVADDFQGQLINMNDIKKIIGQETHTFLRIACSIPVSEPNKTYDFYFDTMSNFPEYNLHPQYWGVFILNQSGSRLHRIPKNHSISFIGTKFMYK